MSRRGDLGRAVFFSCESQQGLGTGPQGRSQEAACNAARCGSVAALNSVESVRNFIARLTAEVYSGDKHPSLARGLAALLLLQLRVLHDADVEERLAILEEKLAKSDKISREPEDPDSANGGTA